MRSVMELLCSRVCQTSFILHTSDFQKNNRVHYIKIKIYNFKDKCLKSVSMNNIKQQGSLIK